MTAAQPDAARPNAARPSEARPNIVLLLADDWGFSDVGAFGGEMATPHLDALAASGMRFANFHVTASCAPTRSMLLTGVDNHRNGVGNMPETIPQSHIGKPGYLGVLDTMWSPSPACSGTAATTPISPASGTLAMSPGTCRRHAASSVR